MNDIKFLESAGKRLENIDAGIDRLLAENRDLRDAIRLIYGRANNVPWQEVPESYVDDYVAAIRELKAVAAVDSLRKDG